ncbi:MAG: membrane protein insertase YidC [Bacteroidia bacterium]|nr:membrane protein insertase YidC [Bacteroidia bacterium]MDW8235949.1 membrane protein insertase YidC [Bacteroidia bacterium]
MSRNTALALFLLTLFMFLWTIAFSWWGISSSSQSASSSPSAQADSVKAPTALPTASDSVDKLRAQYGAYARFLEGGETLFVVQTRAARYRFSSRGARLIAHEIPLYKDHAGKPVSLWDTTQHLQVLFAEGRSIISTERLHFIPVHIPQNPVMQGEDSVVFQLPIAQDTFVRISYLLRAGDYRLRWRIAFHGLAQRLRNPYLSLHVAYRTPQTEISPKQMLSYCALYYKQGEDVESIRPDEDEVEEKVLQGKIDWVSFKGHFFCTILQAQSGFTTARLQNLPFQHLPVSRAELQLPLEGQAAEMEWYLGPARYSLLASYEQEYERQIELGWSIARYINTLLVIPVFTFLEKYIPSYGVIIILLALFIKVLLSPITWQSYRSAIRMEIVHSLPEFKQLEEKYKGQPDKLMIERSLLYKQVGVNPLQGCIPALLQLPIFSAMYSFFPNSFELRQKDFLWVQDLSSYDALLHWGFSIPIIGNHLSLFALVTSVTTLLYSLSMSSTPSTADPSLRWMVYIFPVIFFFFLNDASAALSWYYTVINLLTIGQTWLMKRFTNREAILAQIRAYQRRKTQKQEIAQYRMRMSKWFRKR